jgi:hypothetical protein
MTSSFNASVDDLSHGNHVFNGTSGVAHHVFNGTSGDELSLGNHVSNDTVVDEEYNWGFLTFSVMPMLTILGNVLVTISRISVFEFCRCILNKYSSGNEGLRTYVWYVLTRKCRQKIL